jgi:aldehyde dehydrogenase (NAD+)
MLRENEEAIVKALYRDLSKPHFDTITAEIGGTVKRAVAHVELLETWTKPEIVKVPGWQKSWRPTINKMPKGTVLILL